MKRTINFSSFKMFDNTNKFRLLNNRIIEDNYDIDKFLLEYYNISLFSYEELKQNFTDLSNNYPIYVVMKYDDENPESNTFKLFAITFFTFSSSLILYLPFLSENKFTSFLQILSDNILISFK